jgi:hypothetical protein
MAILSIAITTTGTLTLFPVFTSQKYSPRFLTDTHTTAIVVAGCTSHGLADVYLLSMSYVNSTTLAAIATYPEQVNTNISAVFGNIAKISSLEVRAGYLGLCMRQNPGKWECSSSAAFLAGIVELSSASTGDPLNLIWIASNFRNHVVFVGLMYVFSPAFQIPSHERILRFIAVALSCLALLVLSTFPRWHTETEDSESEREVKPFPSKPASHLATALIALASIFLFMSILWQHIASAAAASMVGSLTYGTAGGSVGTAATALGWTAVFCKFVALAGMVSMVLSIKVLTRLAVE